MFYLWLENVLHNCHIKILLIFISEIYTAKFTLCSLSYSFQSMAAKQDDEDTDIERYDVFFLMTQF